MIKYDIFRHEFYSILPLIRAQGGLEKPKPSDNISYMRGVMNVGAISLCLYSLPMEYRESSESNLQIAPIEPTCLGPLRYSFPFPYENMTQRLAEPHV